MKVTINGKKVEAKLPKEFKKKWVSALRSGKYYQASSSLERHDVMLKNEELVTGHCCLGVACRIQHPKLLLNQDFIVQNVAEKTRKVPAILKGDSDDNGLVEKLADMNDSGKHSFKSIAAWIERYL